MRKLPPIEKIYEAYSAVAEGRVTLFDNHATVLSSNKEKEYTVTWDKTDYAANDNATYWQGYAGYPIIAVLMLQGKLPLDKSVADMFATIDWTELNAAAKRDYAKAVDTVFKERHCDAETEMKSRTEARRVYEALKNLDIEIKRASKRLPSRSTEKE